jgi:hypothetical protein
MTGSGPRRRIEVDIGVVSVGDPRSARPREIAAALEDELARLPAGRALQCGGTRPVAELSADAGRDLSPRAIARAVADALGGEPGR